MNTRFIKLIRKDCNYDLVLEVYTNNELRGLLPCNHVFMVEITTGSQQLVLVKQQFYANQIGAVIDIEEGTTDIECDIKPQLTFGSGYELNIIKKD